MCLHFDLLRTKDLRHDARFIGDEGGAENAHIRAARHLLLAINAERLHQLQVGIGNQRERQLMLFDKLFVRFRILSAATYDGITLRKKALIVISQVASLARTARRCVARIDVEHEFFTGEIAEMPFFSVLVGAKNLG